MNSTQKKEDAITIYSVHSDDIKPKSKSDVKCAPGLEYEAGSCIKIHILAEMARAYNQTASDTDKIYLSDSMEVINPKKYKRYLVAEIDKRIGDKCTSQKCWSSQDFIDNMKKSAKDELKKYTHRPDSPEGKYTWLSTFDINKVIEQYEIKYNKNRDYKTAWYGALPIDFKDLPQVPASHIDYHALYKKGVRQLSAIFNLDAHDQPGSHWVGFFADFSNSEKGGIYYYDSYGTKPGKEVRAFMREISRFMNEIGIPLNKINVTHSKIQSQKGGSECGVYSIRFVVQMLKTGGDFEKVCSEPISDERINKCRTVYFDKHNKK